MKFFRHTNISARKVLLKYLPAIVVFGLTIEISARIDDALQYDAPFWGAYTADRLRTSDAEGIWRNIPNIRFEKWQNNQYGFRGPALSLEKSRERVRIVCMGTSETYGLYESPGYEWPSQLRNLLAEASSPPEIINVSVVGLGLKNYQQYLEKYVLPFRPDIMIVFINPFHYAITQERSRARETVLTFPKSPRVIAGGFGDVLPLAPSDLRSLPKMKRAVKQAIPQPLLKWYQIRDTEKQIREVEALRLQGQTAKDEISRMHCEAFRVDLLSFVAFLKSHNITVILSTYPSLITQENIDRHYEIVLDNRKFCVEYSLKGLIDVSLKLNNEIRDVAAEHQLAFVDSENALLKTVDYFADNVHYTNEGARVLAESMADYIMRHRETLLP